MRRMLVAVLFFVAAMAASLLAGCGTGDVGAPVTAASQSSETSQFPGTPQSGPPQSSGSAGSGSTGNGTPARNPSSLPDIKESDLPPEARETLALIRTGGPYPYRQDDQRFGNFERILPRQPSGYYREYTVETPGETDRGARRIVAGDGGDKYYTSDHYDSFRFIAEGR